MATSGWKWMDSWRRRKIRGPMALDVVRHDTGRWRWQFGAAVNSETRQLGRSGPGLSDLMSLAEAKRQCEAAAIAWAKAVLE